MADLPKEVLEEYIGETREMCERVSLNLALVEKGEHKDETLNSIYRDMHSIKGASQLFGFQQIGNMAHAMESTLDPIRHHILSVTAEIMDALYNGLDIINKLLASIVAAGHEGAEVTKSIELLIPKLASLTVSALGGEFKTTKDFIGIGESRENLAPIQKVANDFSAPVVVQGSMSATASVHAIKPVVVPAADPVVAPVRAIDSQKTGGAKESALPKDEHASDASTIRIQVGLLDNLMNLTGELVLIRNQLLQISGKSTNPEFIKIGQRLNVVTSELQNDVMKTRMQPVGSIVTKFHRVVRDLSRDLGKKIELKIEGAETELDKTLIEAVKDPLTHLVRNCVDHGIEKPDDRRKNAKPESGTITVRSYHEGGQVIVEIVDDGRGLEPQKIGRKAVEKGVITLEQMEKLSNGELQALIFAPGFSTAESVSNISGRGVGMDVVKTNIERIGGAVELESKAGFGTTVRLKIPLTLAIIPALVIETGGARFAMPQVKVSELVRIENDPDALKTERVEFIQDQPVYRLRGKLLPLIDLSRILKLRSDDLSELEKKAVLNVVVLNSDQGEFGLIVDEIVDSSDIVVKPLSQALKGLNVYSGATIMGDGSVVLILDVSGISSIAHLAAPEKHDAKHGENLREGNGKSQDVAEFLLVDIGVSARHAIPLCLVNRLEKFTADQIEKTGDQRVVQYRDKLLPIINVYEFLGFEDKNKNNGAGQVDSQAGGDISVIVMSKGNRDFGLQVNGILDVVLIEGEIDMTLRDRAGIHGSMIYGKEVVVVLDTLAIMDGTMVKLDHRSRGSVGGSKSGDLGLSDSMIIDPSDQEIMQKRKKHKILLAEDTPFFRKHIKGTLESFGFQVVAVVNGEEAFKRMETSKTNEFALLLSDIEMPVMNGLELAQRVRENAIWSKIPIVALTTKFRDKDLELGRAAGFTQYLEKFNPEVLLTHLDRLLNIQ